MVAHTAVTSARDSNHYRRMGQGHSGPAAPAGTIVYDLYGGPSTGCGGGNQCATPSFDHAQFLPVMEPLISQAQFFELKQRVCALTQHYQASSWKFWIPMFICSIVSVIGVAYVGGVLGIPALHVPYVIVVIFVSFFLLNRVVQNNNRVDNQVRGVLTEYHQRLAGSASIAFVTQHTGLCKPKHARIVRQIWFGPPGAPLGGGYVFGVQPQMMAMSPQMMTTTPTAGPQLGQPGTYVPGAAYPPTASAPAYPAAAPKPMVAAIQR